MRRALLLFVTAALCTSFARAEGEYLLTFRTQPAQVDILLKEPGGEFRRLAAQQGTVVLSAADLVGETLEFRLQHPAYEAATVGLPTKLFSKPGNYLLPSQTGAIALEPTLLTCTLSSEPSGAQIFTASDHSYLGRTGEPLHLNLARLWESSESHTVTLDLQMPGYRPQQITLDLARLSSDRLPLVKLAPRFPVVSPVLHHLSRHRDLAGLLVLGSLGVLGWAWRSRSRRSRLHGKQRRLEALVDQQDPMAGQRVGPYRLLAQVEPNLYRALPEESLESEVDREAEPRLLRLIPLQSAFDQGYRLKFEEEVRILLKLRHPSVVQLEDWGEQGDFLYLVTEYVEGESLRQRLPAAGMPLDQFFEVFSALLECLESAHQQGVLHRGIRPESILFTVAGKLKVTDFGNVAESFTGRDLLSRLDDSNYAAPEQVSGAAIDARVDQYGLGLLAFEMLTGRPLFSGGQMSIALGRQQALPELQHSRSDLPEGLAQFVARLLEAAPAARYQNLGEVRRRLEVLEQSYGSNNAASQES